MGNKKYSLRFLPLFEQDLSETVDYISYRLKNPDAAARLVDEVQGAIQKRLNYPAGIQEGKYQNGKVDCRKIRHNTGRDRASSSDISKSKEKEQGNCGFLCL